MTGLGSIGTMVSGAGRLITPPVGLNVFVINKLADGVSMRDSFFGVMSFLVTDFLRIAILILFPAITLGLPRLTNG